MLNPPPLKQAKMVAVGMFHVCALYAEGVKCWGSDEAGQISGIPTLNHPFMISADGARNKTCAVDVDGVKCWGDGHGFSSDKPMPELIHPRMVSVGTHQICALDDEGVKCWGSNFKNSWDVPPLKNPTQVSTGEWKNCAMTEEGAKCWSMGKFVPLD